MKLEDLEAKLGIADMGEEAKLALVKDIQANLPALKAEQRVLEAKTQANLVVEAIKKIKEGLEARFDELNGIVDVKVRDITSGKDGIDGKDGKDGVDGKDGKDGLSITGPKGADGQDGEDGVGVQDAHIDFDGSLIITLTDGRELNVGEVVPFDVAEKIKVIGNGGGTSQSVLDAITALTLATTTNAAITGGTINGATIGATTAAAGTFTTLIGGGGSANYFQTQGATTTKAVEVKALGSDTNIAFVIDSKGTGAIDLAAGSSGVNISNGGTVTAITRIAGGTGYGTAPTVTISAPTTAGGVQATATCTVTAGVVDTTFTITNAGSGYVEQPTVSFFGGGGSGAAAYATVGSVTTIKSIGASTTGVTNASLQFVTPNTTATNYPPLAIRDISGADTGVLISPNSGYTQIVATHATTATMMLASAGTNPIYFNTQGTSQTNQMRVAHTASAVNYVQVTGAATGGGVSVTAQGSDSNVFLDLKSKGSYPITFYTGTTAQFTVAYTASAVNRLQVTGAAAGSAPVLSSFGSDTNIDLTLTPKGTGNVRFGTYTASMALTIQGYVEIKDAGGTVRKLAVIA